MGYSWSLCLYLCDMGELKMKYLIFSEKYPNGEQLTKDDYTKLMSEMTHEDFEAHQAVPVCESMVELLTEVLNKGN